jgi:hypothetical protein
MTNVATSQLINLVYGQIRGIPPENIAQPQQPRWSAGNSLKYPGMPVWILAICISILLHVAFLINFRSLPTGIERRFVSQDTVSMSQRWELVDVVTPRLERRHSTVSGPVGEISLERSGLSTPLPIARPILASSGDTANTLTESYLRLNEVDTPAQPQVSWLLPFKYDYFAAVRSLEFQIWIDADGAIPSVQLLAVGPSTLSQTELQAVVDWIRNTPMFPAISEGNPVPSTRVIEVVLDTSDRQ